jgi:hypothetical protein
MTLADLQISLQVTTIGMILVLELLKYGHEKIIQGDRHGRRTEGLGSDELVCDGPRSTTVNCKFIPKEGIPF